MSAVMKTAGISHQRMADYLGVSRHRVTALLGSGREWKLDEVKALLELFGCDFETIWEGRIATRDIRKASFDQDGVLTNPFEGGTLIRQGEGAPTATRGAWFAHGKDEIGADSLPAADRG